MNKKKEGFSMVNSITLQGKIILPIIGSQKEQFYSDFIEEEYINDIFTENEVRRRIYSYKNISCYEISFINSHNPIYFLIFEMPDDIKKKMVYFNDYDLINDYIRSCYSDVHKYFCSEQSNFILSNYVFRFFTVNLNKLNEKTNSEIVSYLIKDSSNFVCDKYNSYISEKRIISGSEKGIVQLFSGSTTNHIQKRLKYIILALSYAINYSQSSKKISKCISKKEYKNVTEIQKELLEFDAGYFYLNPVRRNQLEGREFWEILSDILALEKNREITLQQTNMLGKILSEEQTREEQALRQEQNDLMKERNDDLNRISMVQNLVFTLLAILIGLTGANFNFTNPKVQSQALFIQSNLTWGSFYLIPIIFILMAVLSRKHKKICFTNIAFTIFSAFVLAGLVWLALNKQVFVA